jgi:hypothetical protein
MYKFIFLFLFAFTLKAQTIPQAEPIEEPAEKPKVEEKAPVFENPKPDFKAKIRKGGNFWFAPFNGIFADVSPMLGYEVNTKGTLIGIGASVLYQGRDKQLNIDPMTVGGRIFVRQGIWRSIFTHAEWEFHNASAANFYNESPTNKNRIWGSSPLIGGGFYRGSNRQQKGQFVAILFNLGYPKHGLKAQAVGNSFGSSLNSGIVDSPLVFRVGSLF